MPAQTVIKLRRDTSANWTSADSVLAAGELGIETDTNRIKIGDGTTEWTGLKYGPVGAELAIRVKNASGSTAIPAGRLVQFAGAAGDTVTASPAVTDGSVDFHSLIGVTSAEIAADGFGDVILTGVVGGLDTSAYTAGTLLYADDANPGQLTSTAPTAPSFGEPVAAVTRAGAGTSGLILVRLHLGSSLSDVHDVTITTPADNEVLAYNDASGTWINQTAAEAGLASASHTHTLANITDVTASAAEVNVLDGITATTTELNYVDGVTSNVQTQLNGKAATSHTHTSSQITDLTTNVVSRTNGTVATAATGSTVVRNITLSTGDPTGGADGDVWLKYTA